MSRTIVPTIPLTDEEWDTLIKDRSQLPECCPTMASLWSGITMIGTYGPNKFNLEDLIERYEKVKKLHNMHMFPNLVKLMQYAYKTLDALEAEEYYGSWF